MSEDDKDRYPLWPTRNNKPLPKIVGWLAFGVIGGGAFQVLFVWLLDLLMDRLIGPEFIPFHANLPWNFFLGASISGALIGCLIAWSW